MNNLKHWPGPWHKPKSFFSSLCIIFSQILLLLNSPSGSLPILCGPLPHYGEEEFVTESLFYENKLPIHSTWFDLHNNRKNLTFFWCQGLLHGLHSYTHINVARELLWLLPKWYVFQTTWNNNSFIKLFFEFEWLNDISRDSLPFYLIKLSQELGGAPSHFEFCLLTTR